MRAAPAARRRARAACVGRRERRERKRTATDSMLARFASPTAGKQISPHTETERLASDSRRPFPAMYAMYRVHVHAFFIYFTYTLA